MRYHIGIDGGKTNGYAIWDKQNQVVVSYDIYNFWELIEVLSGLDNSEVMIHLEYPNFNKPTFCRGKYDKAILDRKAQNVGSVKRTSELIKEYLELHNIQHKLVRPLSRKFNAEMFNKLTGITDSSNQHERDAVMLVYGL